MVDMNNEKGEILVTPEEALELDIEEQLDQPTAEEADAVAEEAAENEEAEPSEYEIVGIRFKKSGKIYYFDPDGIKLTEGGNAIVETARGVEYGSVALSNRTVKENEVVLPLRKVLRAATPEDEKRHEENIAREKEAFDLCVAKIADHKLEMKLIDVEYTFDNNKLLFYFTADGRIDFRELVKDLASVFRTRIELRQIGIRDEAKLLGGLGICGRPFCCSSFLGDFVQVSIKMAKDQNLSLNSAKISGACGRLMCCLRYEYDIYEEELKKTPKMDSTVRTPDGDGTVVEVRPLAEQVKVKLFKDPDQPKVYHRDSVSLKAAGKEDNNLPDDEELRQLVDTLEEDETPKGEHPKQENNEGRRSRSDRRRGGSKRTDKPQGEKQNDKAAEKAADKSEVRPQSEKAHDSKAAEKVQDEIKDKPLQENLTAGSSDDGEAAKEVPRRNRGSRGGRSRQKNRSGVIRDNRSAQDGEKKQSGGENKEQKQQRRPQQNHKNQNGDNRNDNAKPDAPKNESTDKKPQVDGEKTRNYNNRRRGSRRGHGHGHSNGGNGENGGSAPAGGEGK